jgi:hypothetical protein
MPLNRTPHQATYPGYSPDAGKPIEFKWGEWAAENMIPRFATTTLRNQLWVTPPTGALCVTGSTIWMFQSGAWRKILRGDSNGSVTNDRRIPAAQVRADAAYALAATKSTTAQMTAAMTRITALENQMKKASRIIHYKKARRVTGVGTNNVSSLLATGCPAGAKSAFVNVTLVSAAAPPAPGGPNTETKKGWMNAWDPDAGAGMPTAPSMVSFDNQAGNGHGAFLVGLDSSGQFYYGLSSWGDLLRVEFDILGYVLPAR